MPTETPAELRIRSGLKVERFAEAAAHVVEGVVGGRDADRLAAVSADQPEERIAVYVADFAGRERLGDIDQFVAAAEDGDARAALDRHLRLTERRQHAEFLRADQRAGCQHRLPRLNVFADRTDVIAGVDACVNGDDCLAAAAFSPAFHVLIGLLDRDDSIRALRQRRARHDARGLPGIEMPSGLLPAGMSIDHAQ